jgi:hypothetical protein
MPASHPHRIELNLRDMAQLFNSMDPSPFHERDLDHDAEEFIESWAREYPIDEPVALRVHLADWPADDPRDVIRDAVHNYFAYRAKLTDLEFHQLMKQGRTTLVIGTLFLAGCLGLGRVLGGVGDGTGFVLVRESLTIAGWVAMWRPMQLYLYDWWPVRRRGRVYRKLSRMTVEVVEGTKAR